MKRVRITIELDSHFVGLLSAAAQLKQLGNTTLDRQHTPIEVLAVVALAEARGALAEQVHMLTPPEWRPHIEAVHSERRVIEEDAHDALQTR